MTQDDLAERMPGWSQPVVANVERGARAVRVDEIGPFSDALGIDPEVLYRLKESEVETICTAKRAQVAEEQAWTEAVESTARWIAARVPVPAELARGYDELLYDAALKAIREGLVPETPEMPTGWPHYPEELGIPIPSGRADGDTDDWDDDERPGPVGKVEDF